MRSDIDVSINKEMKDNQYLKILREHLENLNDVKSDIILFQAGVDSLKQDKLGHLSLTKEGLKKRNEIVLDFFDKLKSCTKGYASFDYYVHSFEKSQLQKLDILINGEKVDALSLIVHKSRSQSIGRKLVNGMKEVIPRQNFDIAIQAAIGSQIISRATTKAFRKDVTAKLYGGDVTRKMKLLKKQKIGKKRMKQVGKVELPQEAFMAVLKIDTND